VCTNEQPHSSFLVLVKKIRFDVLNDESSREFDPLLSSYSDHPLFGSRTHRRGEDCGNNSQSLPA